jgi:hypothetical protein
MKKDVKLKMFMIEVFKNKAQVISNVPHMIRPLHSARKSVPLLMLGCIGSIEII